MDWSNERYVRLYTRETVDDALLSWEARALWHELLKRFDRAGVIEIGPHGWRGVAVLVRMPPEVVTRAGAELERDGRVEVRGQFVVAPNYIEAQEAKQSDRLRQAESRGRRRDRARAADIGVTPRDETSHAVTRGHGDTPPEPGREGAADDDPEVAPPDRSSRDPGEADPTPKVTLRDTPVTPRDETSHAVTGCHSVPSLAVPSQAKLDSSCSDSPSEPAKKPEPEWARRAADLLSDLIAEHQPDNLSIQPGRWGRTREKWAKQFRLAHERDRRDRREMRELLEWCQRDPFWQSNILSAGKFRQQYDQLKAKRKARTGASARGGGGAVAAFAAEAFELERQGR